jgi:F0F1-type ATP synthase membrane subunit c/vacuolar-type H+-ATPase subunit K
MKKQVLLITIMLLSALLSCKKEENDDNLDDSFDIKASKMEQIGGLFEAIARQPEMADELINATELIYTDYSELLPLSDQAIIQRGKARGYAFGMLFYSVAMQPEIFNKLDFAATKFLGKYNSDDISDELLDITRTYAVNGLNESLARQPEADSLFNVISKRYLNFDISAR